MAPCGLCSDGRMVALIVEHSLCLTLPNVLPMDLTESIDGTGSLIAATMMATRRFGQEDKCVLLSLQPMLPQTHLLFGSFVQLALLP